jgi:hypothetical protein
MPRAFVFFFQDALGEDCLEYQETAAPAFPLINPVPETPTEVTNNCICGGSIHQSEYLLKI